MHPSQNEPTHTHTNTQTHTQTHTHTHAQKKQIKKTQSWHRNKTLNLARCHMHQKRHICLFLAAICARTFPGVRTWKYCRLPFAWFSCRRVHVFLLYVRQNYASVHAREVPVCGFVVCQNHECMHAREVPVYVPMCFLCVLKPHAEDANVCTRNTFLYARACVVKRTSAVCISMNHGRVNVDCWCKLFVVCLSTNTRLLYT
jgi:hypothetical protein